MNVPRQHHVSEARALHRDALVIDTHCDTTQKLVTGRWRFDRRHRRGHVDIPRLREGGIDAAFFAVFAPASTAKGHNAAAARAQIARIRETVARHAAQVAPAASASDVRAAKAEGKIAVVIAIEGGHLIDESLDVLRAYRDAGAVYLTLTHATHTAWADSSGIHGDPGPRHRGLTSFGRDVVRELNRLGMIVDVSHVSDATLRDVLDTSTAPIIASHSSCRAVAPHRRNLSDEMIRAIAAAGGTVQINFCSVFIDPHHPQPDPHAVHRFLKTGRVPRGWTAGYVTPLEVLVDHFAHALQLVGPQHVGIGSDFDGVFTLPDGMQDCSMLPNLTAALMARGFGAADLKMILGENVLRVMDACRQEARRIQGAPQESADAPRGVERSITT